MKKYFCTKCNELFISTDDVPVCPKCSDNSHILPGLRWDNIIFDMIKSNELTIESYNNLNKD